MKKHSKQKDSFKDKYKTVTIKITDWKKLTKIRTTYEFKTLGETIGALVNLEKQFKPELKEEAKK